MQVAQLLDALQARGAAWADGVLLCGDLNTDPHDVAAKMRAKCVPTVLAHPLGLRSAYPLPESEAPPPLTTRPHPKHARMHEARTHHHQASTWWTTWKKRGAYEIKHAIDYIFHDAGLRAVRVLAPPNERELEPARLPGIRYPSDHLSILAQMQICC